MAGMRRLRLPWRQEEPPPERIERSAAPRLRLAEESADRMIGNSDAGVQRLSGEPAPVEADEAAWQLERERRERDGRS
jgi:hypothetical protein